MYLKAGETGCSRELTARKRWVSDGRQDLHVAGYTVWQETVSCMYQFHACTSGSSGLKCCKRGANGTSIIYTKLSYVILSCHFMSLSFQRSFIIISHVIMSCHFHTNATYHDEHYFSKYRHCSSLVSSKLFQAQWVPSLSLSSIE